MLFLPVTLLGRAGGGGGFGGGGGGGGSGFGGGDGFGFVVYLIIRHPVVALVNVRWSGELFNHKKGLLEKVGKKHIHQSGYLLGKKSGKSVSGYNVSSAHCSNCGAAEKGGASNACEYCGVIMNDGTSDWVLCDIISLSGHEAKRFIDQSAQQSVSLGQNVNIAPVVILHWAVKMGLSDGVLDSKELVMLESMAAKMETSSLALAAIIENAKSGTEPFPEPKDYGETLFWLNTLADIVLVDGRISKREFAMLCVIGKKYKYTQYDIKNILKQRKNKLYKSSRQALKIKRRSS